MSDAAAIYNGAAALDRPLALRAAQASRSVLLQPLMLMWVANDLPEADPAAAPKLGRR